MKVKNHSEKAMPFTSGSMRSIPVHVEPEQRAAVQISRMKQEYDRRLLQYEKEFDVSLSRFAARDKAMKESMLAYTARMRSIQNSRQGQDSNGSSSDSDPLFIRAQHIPKVPITKTQRRRPASLDELTGKAKERQETREKNPPKSASRISLPSLPDRLTKGATHHVKISFVSASDLYDIVDFSLRNKGTKADTLKFLQMEAASKQKVSGTDQTNHYDEPTEASKESETQKDNFLPPIQGEKKHFHSSSDKDNDEDIDKNVSKLPMDSLKISRPNRAKRMKLHSSQLDVIPEIDTSSNKNNERARSPLPKISPRILLGAKMYLDNLNEPGTPSRANKKDRFSRKNDNEALDISSVKLGNGLRGHNSNQMKAKYKAHKRFKNLIFLRDVPERKSRI